MKPVWYADKRDLVKWSILITLAKKNDIRRIIYTVYLGETEWSQIQIDDLKSNIPREVLAHFRDISDIKRMENKELEITIIDAPFRREHRDIYKTNLLEIIKGMKEKIIVFLDPDTGLEPENGRGSERHVTERELTAIWTGLRKGYLVLYQHRTNRAGTDWIAPKKKQFMKCLEAKEADISIGKSFGIANDVIFLIAKK